MEETFGPEYVRPAQKDCPDCPCCTIDLCRRGRNSIMRCAGLTPDEHRATVQGCPCSAPTTPDTAAWRAERVRVTRLARELPVSGDAEELLRRLAAGGDAEQDPRLFPQLQVRGLATLSVDRKPVITELGRTYLAARDQVRLQAVVHVLDIDVKARTARVEVPGWRPGIAVTVQMDQVTGDSGLKADQLPGRWMAAEANCHAEEPGQLVLTGFRDKARADAGLQKAGDRP